MVLNTKANANNQQQTSGISLSNLSPFICYAKRRANAGNECAGNIRKSLSGQVSSAKIHDGAECFLFP